LRGKEIIFRALKYEKKYDAGRDDWQEMLCEILVSYNFAGYWNIQTVLLMIVKRPLRHLTIQIRRD